jgi:hypothetical protein
MRTVLSAVVALLVLPAWASDPGEPLDCSDWVFLEPGLSCEMVIPPDGIVPNLTDLVDIDNEGDFYRIGPSIKSWCAPPCDVPPLHLCLRRPLIRNTGGVETTIAYVEDRCNDDYANPRADAISVRELRFDRVNGSLLLLSHSGCQTGECGYEPPWAPDGGQWLASISGFATLAEVLEGELPPGPPGPPGPQGPPGPLIPACPDADGDAWADCETDPTCHPYGHPCGDCDDSNSRINPGGPPGQRCEPEEEPTPMPLE